MDYYDYGLFKLSLKKLFTNLLKNNAELKHRLINTAEHFTNNNF